MAGRRAGFARWAHGVAFCAALAACSPIYRSHGYVPSEQDLQQISVGVDTRDTVEAEIGSPSIAGVVGDEAWYYVQSDWVARGYFAPEEIRREVVAISFGNNGTVRNIERFGLADGRVIALNRRVTESNVQGVSFIRQLLGNVGNFRAEDFVE
jgi:outer membrane protein assembly factor BamE (lipoprotein component of BamABCDE complex)